MNFTHFLTIREMSRKLFVFFLHYIQFEFRKKIVVHVQPCVRINIMFQRRPKLSIECFRETVCIFEFIRQMQKTLTSLFHFLYNSENIKKKSPGKFFKPNSCYGTSLIIVSTFRNMSVPFFYQILISMVNVIGLGQRHILH